MRRVFMRIDPESVIVAVRNSDLVEQVPAVGGLVGLHVHDVEHIFVARIGDHVHVVPGPLPQAVAGVHQLPRFAAIVGAIESAVRIVGLDQRIDAIRIGGDRHADFSIRPLGQAVLFEVLPGRASIVRAVEAAARAAAGHAPRSAPRLPERGKKNVGIMRIEGDVDAARVFVFVENFLPGLAAVGGAEDAALGVRAVRMAESRDESDVGIGGIDNDFADGARIVQANVLPGLAAVERLVNAVAVRNVAANAGFAGPHIKDVVVRSSPLRCCRSRTCLPCRKQKTTSWRRRWTSRLRRRSRRNSR